MASPIGHAAAGAAVAAIVARVTGTPTTPAFWIGAIVASGIPDLDVIAPLLGFSRRFHRGVSHSLLVIGLLIVAGWIAARTQAPGLEQGTLLAWSAALLSHPFLDVITTGPKIASWGIPLFWPLSPRRFWVKWPILGDREEGLTVADQLRETRDDLLYIVPVCAGAILIALFLK